MKNITILVVILFATITALAQTNGQLEVVTTTSTAGGKYAPRNIVSIWIKDSQNNFIKTLLVYADKRKTHLNNWQSLTSKAGVEYNSVDAITGATQSNHGTRTCSWDGTDYNKSLVADGGYKLCMELTDKNSTGNYTEIEFNKSETAFTLKPEDVDSFSSTSVTWTPDNTSSSNKIKNEINPIYPNPGNGIYSIENAEGKEIEVWSANGKLIKKTNGNIVDISSEPDGIYLFSLINGNKRVISKVVKH